MRRILLISTSYPEGDEGAAAAGVFVRDFADELARQGCAVDVVAPAVADGVFDRGALREIRFAVPRLPLSSLRPGNPADWSAILRTLYNGRRAVLRACGHSPPDHVLALWALPSGAWAGGAAKRCGVPYSVWSLGSDIWTLSGIPVLRRYLARVLRGASHRFADGYLLAGDVEAICAMPCAFLPSSRRFGQAGGRGRCTAPPYRLAFLGRWHPNKGVDLLLDALGRLDEASWQRIAGVRLHGGGPLDHLVRRRAAELARAGRPVELGGYLDLEGARALFEWTDYVVIPSRIESIPVVFSDAMQAGRPVIATPVGDLGRILAELPCGIPASGAEAEAIARAIGSAVNLEGHGFDAAVAAAARRFDPADAAATFLSAIGGGATGCRHIGAE